MQTPEPLALKQLRPCPLQLAPLLLERSGTGLSGHLRDLRRGTLAGYDSRQLKCNGAEMIVDASRLGTVRVLHSGHSGVPCGCIGMRMLSVVDVCGAQRMPGHSDNAVVLETVAASMGRLVACVLFNVAM